MVAKTVNESEGTSAHGMKGRAVANEIPPPHAHTQAPTDDDRGRIPSLPHHPLAESSWTPFMPPAPSPPDLRVYARALAEDEIAALAAMHTPGAPA